VPLSDLIAEPVDVKLSQCTSCASGTLGHDKVSTALWRGKDLVVIEGIPALVCSSCGERYFEDKTAMAIDMMQAGKGNDHTPERMMSVPVYAFAVPGDARTEESVP